MVIDDLHLLFPFLSLVMNAKAFECGNGIFSPSLNKEAIKLIDRILHEANQTFNALLKKSYTLYYVYPKKEVVCGGIRWCYSGLCLTMFMIAKYSKVSI